MCLYVIKIESEKGQTVLLLKLQIRETLKNCSKKMVTQAAKLNRKLNQKTVVNVNLLV